MLIFKVMVCFLAVFSSEDYVGGLPSIQDSPDNHQAGQSARSASNQRVTNEPSSRSTELLDYAERHEEMVERKRVDRKRGINNVAENSPFQIFGPRFGGSSETKEMNERLKFSLDVRDQNEKVHRDALSKGSSGTDQRTPFNDKSKSRNDDQPTSPELLKVSRDPTLSHGIEETQRFSSVYAKMELDEKVNKKKQEFKNDLSAYVTDVLDSVVSGKTRTSTQSSIETSENLDIENVEIRNVRNSEIQGSGSLLAEKVNVPRPEEESIIQSTNVKDDSQLENRQRKSIGNVVTWHQQSTNMRPTRTQHLVQNKRSPGEGTVLKLPGYGVRRSVAKNGRSVGIRHVHESNRRHFTGDGSSSSRGNQLQFAGLNPVQINAAIAYSNRQPAPQALNIDLSRALYQFGPSQLHALRGVFDKVPPSTQNFKPIAPKQVAYVPPRVVFETKIVPTPFMPFRTEQKTVEALSALLGQNPAQQLQGFNLILRTDRPEKLGVESTNPTPTPEISRQDIYEPVALSQAFVTPIPSIDINSELADGSFKFSNDGGNPHEDVRDAIESPFDQNVPHYSLEDNIGLRENEFKTIPIVEGPEETQRGQGLVEKESPSVWNGVQDPETTEVENEGRYHHQNEEEPNHGEGYAAKYRFGYHVKDYDSGNNFGHEEARDGVVTNGRYHVLLPDGRIQDVTYHVDEGGYHAKVSYQLNPSL